MRDDEGGTASTIARTRTHLRRQIFAIRTVSCKRNSFILNHKAPSSHRSWQRVRRDACAVWAAVLARA